MTKINYEIPKDLETYKQLIDKNVGLLLGTKNIKEISEYKKGISELVKEVIIRPQNSILDTEILYSFDDISDTVNLSLGGFKNGTPADYNKIISGISKGIWNIIILKNNNYILEDRKKITGDYHKIEIDENNNEILKVTIMGLINKKSGDISESGTIYGKMIYDSLIKLLIESSINEKYDEIFIDGIKEKNNKEKLFTGLTRLMIAAYSNKGLGYFNSTIENGRSIFDYKIKTSTNSVIYANSFLHSIVYDTLEIEEEYDLHFGNGSFERMATKMDEVYENIIYNEEPIYKYSTVIKSYINKISELAKLRKEYYQKEGSIGKSEAKLITLSYNHILKSVLNDIEPLIILKEEN